VVASCPARNLLLPLLLLRELRLLLGRGGLRVEVVAALWASVDGGGACRGAQLMTMRTRAGLLMTSWTIRLSGLGRVWEYVRG
jgi:hypothetical protein